MNWLVFLMGFCTGAMLVLVMFYVWWAQLENDRADAEFSAIWGDQR